MTNRILMIISALIMTGCKATQMVLENADALNEAADTASGFGPYGAIGGLIISTIIAGSKWYENKSNTKQLIESVQKAKSKLKPEAKKILVDGLSKHTPSKIKKIVAKVKRKM